jgi:hypothetical protein
MRSEEKCERETIGRRERVRQREKRHIIQALSGVR